MSCIYKIKEGMGSFTDTEKKLAEYILENKGEITLLSTQELSERVNTSAAAVVRFAKKLGYKGFPELKVELAKDSDDEDDDFNEVIKASDSIDIMVKKAEVINLKAMSQTYRLMNMNHLKEAIDLISNCNNIYIFGVGASGLVAQDFQYKLSRIKRIAIYQKDSHTQLISAVNIEPNDIAIGISYSGETKEVNLALKKAKELGAKTIGITKFNNTLSKIVDISLHVPSEEKEIRVGAITSRISALVITDLLYLGVAKNNLKKTEEYILKTREFVKKIK